jgi:hypothetical protein
VIAFLDPHPFTIIIASTTVARRQFARGIDPSVIRSELTDTSCVPSLVEAFFVKRLRPLLHNLEAFSSAIRDPAPRPKWLDAVRRTW